MGKPSPIYKAEELLRKYKSKQDAITQATQIYYLSGSPYWQEVINELTILK